MLSKALLVLCSLFLNQTVEKKYDIVYEEKEEVIESCGNYQVVLKDNYYLQGEGFSLALPNIDSLKMFVDESIVIFYISSSKLNILNVSLEGEVLKNDLLDSSLFDTQFDVYKTDKYYLYATITNYYSDSLLNLRNAKGYLGEKDIVKYTINLDLSVYRINLFGGEEDEEIEKCQISLEDEYILGRKDVLTGGDFGNVGEEDGLYFLARIHNNQVINVISLKDIVKINDFKVINEELYLITNKKIFVMDKNFNIIKSKTLQADSEDGFIMDTSFAVSFANKKIYLYDLETLYLLKEFNSDLKINNVRKLDTSFFSNNYIFDIVYYEYYPKIILSGTLPIPTLFSVFGGGKYLNYTSTPLFSYQNHGEYELEYEYELESKMKYVLVNTVTINKSINIVEGRIYPINYRIYFSGKAYLNQKEIYNNYPITEEGDYVLELYDNLSNKETICFKVSSLQVAFIDDASFYCDKEIEINTPFSVTYKLSSKMEIDILYFVVDGREYTDFVYNKANNTIVLNFDGFSELGTKKIKVEKIVYDDGFVQEVILGDDIVIDVLGANLGLKIENSSEEEIKVEVDDLYNTARHFEVTAQSADEKKVYKYPINDCSIILSDLHGEFKVSIGIVFDIGNGIDSYQEILNLDVEDINQELIGEVKITKYEDTLKEFKILVNKDKLKQIAINDTIIYQKQTKKIWVNFIYGAATFACLGGITFGAFYLKSKRKVA